MGGILTPMDNPEVKVGGLVKWEYRRVAEPTPSELNELGREGWELVSVVPVTHFGNMSHAAFLKRPVLPPMADSKPPPAHPPTLTNLAELRCWISVYAAGTANPNETSREAEALADNAVLKLRQRMGPELTQATLVHE